MIPVSKKPEPHNFDTQVRQPGKNYLKSNPKPTNKDFKNHRAGFWKNSLDDLYSSYDGICAYTSQYFPRYNASVDHFIAKTIQPNLAYEWDNFRLSLAKINGYKGDSNKIIDPFVVQNGWFHIDFPACLIKPNPALSPTIRNEIQQTISILKLNDDDTFVQERCDIMMSLAGNEITISFLRKRYPFLASEIERQGIEPSLKKIFKTM